MLTNFRHQAFRHAHSATKLCEAAQSPHRWIGRRCRSLPVVQKLLTMVSAKGNPGTFSRSDAPAFLLDNLRDNSDEVRVAIKVCRFEKAFHRLVACVSDHIFPLRGSQVEESNPRSKAAQHRKQIVVLPHAQRSRAEGNPVRIYLRLRHKPTQVIRRTYNSRQAEAWARRSVRVGGSLGA